MISVFSCLLGPKMSTLKKSGVFNSNQHISEALTSQSSVQNPAKVWETHFRPLGAVRGQWNENHCQMEPSAKCNYRLSVNLERLRSNSDKSFGCLLACSFPFGSDSLACSFRLYGRFWK